MKKKKATISAAELMAQLNANPEFVSARAKEEEERQTRAVEWRRAEAPLVAELREAGFEVESAWDLVNTASVYQAALPILVEHLSKQYPDAVKEGIARALAVPDARFGWDAVKRAYLVEGAGRAKDGLAVAIAAIADDDVIDQVIELAKDPGHGASRLLLLRALERSSNPEAKVALAELGADPQLAKEVRAILGR